MTMRIGVANAKFNLKATNMVHDILASSFAPDSMALAFMNELGKVSGISGLGGWLADSLFLQGFADPGPEE